jgi:alkaline phosphatase D
MKTKLTSLLLFLLFFNLSSAQKDLLQAGPMLGYSDFREVLIWVQTTEEADVVIAYTNKDGEKKFTKPYSTNEDEHYIAKIYPKPLEYGETYTYEVLINNQKINFDYDLEFESLALWQYRTDPPDFSFALGSCFYANDVNDDRPGKPYGTDYKIFNSILEKDPNFMVWLGDNVYLRTPDFLTETGLNHRYEHTRRTKELQPLLASVHHYATWDDHDYGPNNSDKSYANKKITEKLFNQYWGNLNTNVVGNGGITSHFLWHDVEFFLMDNRYHRDSNELKNENKDYFGKEQLDWLINALATSNATFKIVATGGQIISDYKNFENYVNYPTERNTLLKRLEKNKIEGVLFLSGDRHHTEVSRMERKNAYPLIDFTCSPLTSGTHEPRDEANSFRLKDKTFFERNFGIINVSGESKNRKLLLMIYDAEGKKVWDYSLKASELRYEE